jgi:hypothetical protein
MLSLCKAETLSIYIYIYGHKMKKFIIEWKMKLNSGIKEIVKLFSGFMNFKDGNG